MSLDCLIVGGGLAGLSAAHQLNQAGHRVTLLEKRQRLGGRASSYALDSFPLEIDNCQHVLTGSCRDCLSLIRETAGDGALEKRHTIPVLPADEDAELEYWRLDRAPVPLHFWSIWRQASGSLVRAIRDGLTVPGLLWGSGGPDKTAADWLRRYQSKQIIEKLWRPLTTSALNETLERVSLSMFRKWVITGLMQDPTAAEIYIPSGSLKDLYGNQVGSALEQQGVDIHRGTRVQRIEPSRPAVQLEGGTRQTADVVISALPDRVLWARLPGAVRDREPFKRIADWEHAPIISVHLYFKQSIRLPEFALLSDSPFEWLFALRQPEQGTYAQCVKSAAWEAASWDHDRLVSTATEAIRPLLGSGIAPERSRVVKEKNATLAMTPAQQRQRFGPETPFPNFFVAGDWIDQPWPPTMESAVRAGRAAASRVDDAIASPPPDPVSFFMG